MHFQRTFPLISTFFECSFLLKEHYRFTFFECSFSKLLKHILQPFSMHIFHNIYFFECSFLLKEYYSIKLLAWAPRVTNRVIYWQLVSVFNSIFPGSYNYSDVPQQLHMWCMMNFSFWFSQGVSVIQMCLRIQMNPGLSGFCMWKAASEKSKSKRLKNNFYAFSTHISPNIYFFRMLIFT